MPARTSKATNPWAAIDDVIRGEFEPIGQEWRDIQQLKQAWGINRSNAMTRANKLVQEGKLKRWSGLSLRLKRRICKYAPA